MLYDSSGEIQGFSTMLWDAVPMEDCEVVYSGDDIEIGFNVNYLLDALAAVEEENVQVGLVDPSSSCVVRSPNDDKSLYVVMPMRL